MGGLPRYPFWGDSPVVLSRRPPLDQFPDGRAVRPLRLYAGPRHGASLRDIVFLCALVGPLFPPPPAPCLPYVPFLCVRLSCCCCFFFWVLCSRSLLLPRALRVPLALLCATLVPLPCAPSLACLPSHSPSRCPPCLYVCPPCLCRTVTRVCHPRALPLPLPLAPTLSPGCSLGPRLSPHPGCLAPCMGGGVYLWSGLWPCTHHAPETLVEFPPLHLHCGAQPHSQCSHSAALRRCPMAPVATKAWRGQPL